MTGELIPAPKAAAMGMINYSLPPEELDAAGGKVFVAAQPSKSVPFRQAAARMAGEVIDCVAERKKQYETLRQDIAGINRVAHGPSDSSSESMKLSTR